MKKIRFTALFILLALIAALAAPSAAALDEPQLGCQTAVLLAYDGTSETVLLTRNEHEKVYPASLTKVMTVLLAVEAIESGSVKPNDPVTVQEGFDFDMIEGGTSVYLGFGETMTLENLLYCAMVASANDACNVIAQYISGSVSAFVERMNERAAELGCTETHFTNTHGLPDENHYTTAWDFTRILKEAVGHDLFMQYCNTAEYTVPATNASAERVLSSTNSLINPNNPLYPGDYLYEYAKGVKTGHTEDAGYCLASTAEKDNVRLLAVVMKGQAYMIDDANWYYDHFADSISLYDWAFENFSYQEIVKSTEIVANAPIEMGADTDTVSVRPSTSITALLPNDTDPNSFERTVTLYSETTGETLQAPISAGQEVGEISVSLDGKVYGSAKLVTSTSVDLSRVQYMRSNLKNTLHQPVVVITFWVLVLLFVLYILLVIRYRVKRKAYQKRLEEARRMQFDMSDDEEEQRYTAKPRATAAAVGKRQEVALEPDSLAEAAADVDEPTRVNTSEMDLAEEEGQTRPFTKAEDVPAENGERDYFEEFFGKK